MKNLEVPNPKFGIEERAAVFEPDSLLPSQYADRTRGRRELDPDRRLMLAVLETAVNDYFKSAGASDRERLALFREVEEWVESRDPRWLFSFENICDVLGLDADYVRGGLRAWKERAARTHPEAPPEPGPTDAQEQELRRASGE